MYLALEFLIGQLMNVLKRADLIIRSPKNQAYNLRSYLRDYGLSTLIQLSVNEALFTGVLDNPWLLGQLWKPLAQFHWNWGGAFVTGFIFHNGLDWAMERYPVVRKFFEGGSGGATG